MNPKETVAKALAEDPEGNAYWDCVEGLQKLGTRPVFEMVSTLCARPDSNARRLGLNVLAQLGYERGRPFLEETLRIATTLAEDADPTVRNAALHALGYQWDSRALPTLLSHLNDPDPEVRLAVVQGMPSLVGSPPKEAAVAALIKLSRDSDSHVRDWATFGLGSLLDVDGEEIREALAQRLDDPEGDTAGEALVGLARRQDPRVAGRIGTLLDDPNVGNLIVEAAAELADPGLLPRLERLQEHGWPDDDPRSWVLEAALAACREGRRPIAG